MSDISLTFTGQQPTLTVRNGEIVLVTGEEAIEQQLRLRLKFFLGEFFLDELQGIPYYREVFIKNPNLQLLRSIFTQAILSTPRIASVDSLELSIDGETRTLNLAFVATMDTDEELVFAPFILEL
jgi:hypothetical protein